MTSSPGRTPSARSAIVMASVPLPTPIDVTHAEVVGELALEGLSSGPRMYWREAATSASRAAIRSW